MVKTMVKTMVKKSNVLDKISLEIKFFRFQGLFSKIICWLPIKLQEIRLQDLKSETYSKKLLFFYSSAF